MEERGRKKEGLAKANEEGKSFFSSSAVGKQSGEDGMKEEGGKKLNPPPGPLSQAPRSVRFVVFHSKSEGRSFF